MLSDIIHILLFPFSIHSQSYKTRNKDCINTNVSIRCFEPPMNRAIVPGVHLTSSKYGHFCNAVLSTRILLELREENSYGMGFGRSAQRFGRVTQNS